MKGIPIYVYLNETGEFRWIPTSEACDDKEKAKEILKILRKMPEDRRAVWASKLDQDEAKTKCPVIPKEADLCKEFDDLCSSYNRPKPEKSKEKEGGESTK
jgi:chromatin segregation and condensation protein Rec8/ScpA/Scc1 (kleisin family)